MIRYDYIIERDEGNQVREYRPYQFPKELQNVVYIQGPNSSGKSTLLNLIALSFFGLHLDENELKSSLRERIDNLINSDHQKIRFKVEVENELLSVKLISKKENIKERNFQVCKVVEGKEITITPEMFKREFRVIYDIPDRPLQRLPQLLNEIEAAIKSKNSEVGQLLYYTNQLIRDINDSKDVGSLDKLRSGLKQYKTKKETITLEIEGHQKDLKRFQQFFFSKYYLNYKEKLKISEDKLKKLKKAEKSVASRNKKCLKELDEIKERFNSIWSRIIRSNDESKNLIQSIDNKVRKDLFKSWSVLDIKTAMENEISLKTFTRNAQNIIQELEESKRKIILNGGGKYYNEAIFFESLIKLLEEYKDTQIKIPGINKSIQEFMEIVKEQVKSLKLLEIIEDINKCVSKIKKILEDLKDAFKYNSEHKNKLDNLKTLDEDQAKVFDKKEQNDLLRNDVRIFKKKVEEFENKLIEINTKVEETQKLNVLFEENKEFYDYHSCDEQGMWKILDEKEKNLSEMKKKNDKIQEIIIRDSEKIKVLEKKKPNKYQNYYSEIQQLNEVLRKLEQKMSVKIIQYLKKIRNISEMNKNLGELGNDEKEFGVKLSKYLGQKIQTIRHIESIFEVEKIDIVNKIIITKNGKKIKFADLGTGQSQAAYLSGLLNISDERKIIVLFDEVAMMDSKSLDTIFEKLRFLYKNKKLLLGIIVQKSDDPKVESII